MMAPMGDRLDSGALWDDLVGAIDQLRGIVYGEGVPADDLHRAEGVRYLLRFLAAGIAVCVEHDDAEHPEIGTLIENRRSWGLDNPDTKYGFTRLLPNATYRIRGTPGSARYQELQVNTGHFADGDFAGWKCRWRWGTDDIDLRPDGTAETLLETGPDASYLHVREYFSDWEREEPACWSVERVGATYPPEPLSPSTLEARVDLLIEWLTTGARCWEGLGRGLATGEPGDITPFVPPQDATGLGGQAYGMGAYRCGPDEAVILELRPPVCRYWSLSLATWFWESADIANRQCSINDTQARVDPDGVVRAVIAHRDPGVANWLDPAGYERGTLAVRYLFAETIPTVTCRTVPFGELDRELPDSPRVSPVERAEILRARRAALVRRYRR